MREFLAALGLALASAGAARCADKPLIAPAPAWVKPVAIPDIPPGEEALALHSLLEDTQLAFLPGTRTRYWETAVKIGTVQGLSAGDMSIPWQPGIETLTIHKLVIRRGSKIIDVLASGKLFNVLRREQNLESAILDGELTANMEVEGLEVGDILDFAASITTKDPTVKSHAEDSVAFLSAEPVRRMHFRAQWADGMTIRARPSPAMPALHETTQDGLHALEFALDDAEPVHAPKGSPPRYWRGRVIDLSDFTSWAEVGALMAPLYAEAARLPLHGPLRDELDRIAHDSADPKRRAEAALALVEDRIRYFALAMGTGGLVPAPAEETWSRRFGDCKGKTALLLALLHGLGIEAVPVIVAVEDGDGLDGHLPMIAPFDHVIVRATINGRPYWLDGTRSGDESLDRLRVPAYFSGLPLLAQGSALVGLMPPPLAAPEQDSLFHIDASTGLTIAVPAQLDMVFRGDAAEAVKSRLANLIDTERTRSLRSQFKSTFEGFDVTTTSMAYRGQTGELLVHASGKYTMDWSGGGWDPPGTGFQASDMSRDPGPDAAAPFAVLYPAYTRFVLTVNLPPGFRDTPGGSSANVDETVAGVEIHRHTSIRSNVFTIEKTERSLVPQFPASEAPAAEAELRRLSHLDIELRRPDSVAPTDAEIQDALAQTPRSAEAYVHRGYMLARRGRRAEAIKDFTSAHALDPKNPWAVANRALQYVRDGDFADARKDLEAAAAIDARNPVLLRARGLLAEAQDDPKGAVAAYTEALAVDPANAWALERRAIAHDALGETDLALADAAAALRQAPFAFSMVSFRARVFRESGRFQDAAHEAEALLASHADNSEALLTASAIEAALGRRADALALDERVLHMKATASAYVVRSTHRAPSDIAGRRADLDEALRLNVGSFEALQAKIDLQVETGDYAGAASTATDALGRFPDLPLLLAKRGIAYARLGDKARSTADFDAARAHAASAPDLNTVCWAEATAGVALSAALNACDAALAKAPGNPHYLDSRALVLLRLGRLDEARKNYDAALARKPFIPGSLFGRAIVEARAGDRAAAWSDKMAAREADPEIGTEFERYGLTMPELTPSRAPLLAPEAP